MNNTNKYLRGVLALSLALYALSISGFAHGGEDHSADAPVVSASSGMHTRTARAGEWEVTIKHPIIEPDHETTARVFVTQFETNEPIADARIFIQLNDSTAQEIPATPGTTAGIYEVNLPPLQKGKHILTARVAAGNVTESILFGEVDVTTPTPAEDESNSSLARTGLIALVTLLALGAVGAIGYRLSQNNRRVKEEPVSA